MPVAPATCFLTSPGAVDDLPEWYLILILHVAPGVVVAITVAAESAAIEAGRLAMSRASPAGAGVGVDAGVVGAPADAVGVAASDVGAGAGGGVGAPLVPETIGPAEAGAPAETDPFDVEPGVVGDWAVPAAAMPPGVDGPLGEVPAPVMPRLPLTVANTSPQAAKNAPMLATAE
jgi:hypothetical protein